MGPFSISQHRHCTVMASHTFGELFDMVDANDFPALAQALNEGADVNILEDESGATLLMYAAEDGNVEAVQVLVDSKASLDIKTKDGKTALDIAQGRCSSCPTIMKRVCECAELLIKAALERDVNQQLLEKENTHSVMSNHTFHDLFHMMYDNNFPALAQALDEGADVNMVDGSGQTLLMNAARNGRLEQLRFLVEFEACLDIQDEDGDTALDWAQGMGETECAELLIEANGNYVMSNHTFNDLAGMLFCNDFPALEQALNEGADVNMLDGDGSTLLMNAAVVGKVESLQFLIDSKASIDIQDEDGETALDYAQDLGKTECVELLIAAALENDLSRVASTN